LRRARLDLATFDPITGHVLVASCEEIVNPDVRTVPQGLCVIAVFACAPLPPPGARKQLPLFAALQISRVIAVEEGCGECVITGAL